VIIDHLTLWQRLTWAAHLWKALSKQHHKDLAPQFARYLADDGVVLDVGAHAGQFSKLFAALVPQGRVYAFEPGSYALSILRKTIRFKGLGNVRIAPFGLGSRAGFFPLSLPLKKRGSVGYGAGFVGDAALEPRQSVSETIEIRILDEFIEAENIARVDFIKADIEGFELEMLRGAAQLLARDHPAVFIEINHAHLKREGGSAEEIFRLMADAGYFSADLATGAPLADNQPQQGDILFLARDDVG